MAFCTGGLAIVRKLYNEISEPLEKAMDEIIDFTGIIKKLEGNPTIEAIVTAIPEGSKVQDWLNEAMDKIIIPVTGVVKSGVEKLGEWLENKSELEKNADLLKLASTMTSAADSNTQAEHFYDSAVQLHIISNKVA
jgi:hypothetical protein